MAATNGNGIDSMFEEYAFIDGDTDSDVDSNDLRIDGPCAHFWNIRCAHAPTRFPHSLMAIAVIIVPALRRMPQEQSRLLSYRISLTSKVPAFARSWYILLSKYSPGWAKIGLAETSIDQNSLHQKHFQILQKNY